MDDTGRADGYVELRDTAKALIEREGPRAAATAFGVDELLTSRAIAPEEELAVFAFLEAQGYCGAQVPSTVLSRFAASAVSVAHGSGGHFGELSREGHAVVAGWNDGGVVLVHEPDRGFLVVRDASRLTSATTVAECEYVVALDIAHAAHVTPDSAPGPESVRIAATRLRLGAAAEMLGACTRQLDEAIVHTRTREQFGRPLAAFTPVQDMLAWAAAERHQLVALLDVGLEGTLTDDRHLVAHVAKGLAGRVARSVAQHTLQALGGIGFTWEHDHHRLTRRSLALDAVGGSAAELASELGASIRQTGELPDLLRL